LVQDSSPLAWASDEVVPLVPAPGSVAAAPMDCGVDSDAQVFQETQGGCRTDSESGPQHGAAIAPPSVSSCDDGFDRPPDPCTNFPKHLRSFPFDPEGRPQSADNAAHLHEVVNLRKQRPQRAHWEILDVWLDIYFQHADPEKDSMYGMGLWDFGFREALID